MAMRWNACDVCGRFIPYQDFADGTAVRALEKPASEFSDETYETRCKAHKRLLNATAQAKAADEGETR